MAEPAHAGGVPETRQVGTARGATQDRKGRQMSPYHAFRIAILGLATVASVVAVAPTSAQEREHVITLAPASSALDHRVITAQQALQAGDLGSMQEEALFSLVTASISPSATRGADAIMARRVLVAQQALASPNLGSLQEEALTAIVDAEGDRQAHVLFTSPLEARPPLTLATSAPNYSYRCLPH